MPPRVVPVIDFPVPITSDMSTVLPSILDVLRKSVGKVTPPTDIPMVFANAGIVVAAGANTVIEGSHRALNTHEGYIQQMRVCVRGQTNAGSQDIEIFDATANAQLCKVTLTNALAFVIGIWTGVPDFNSDHTIVVRSIGNGVNTQTLYGVSAQVRTIHLS